MHRPRLRLTLMLSNAEVDTAVMGMAWHRPRLRLTLMLSIAEVEAAATGASVDMALVDREAMADMEATAD